MHLPGGRASRGGVPRGDARFLELISVRGGTPTYLRADRDTLCVFSVMPRVCLPCPPKQKRAAYTALGQGGTAPFLRTRLVPAPQMPLPASSAGRSCVQAPPPHGAASGASSSALVTPSDWNAPPDFLRWGSSYSPSGLG